MVFPVVGQALVEGGVLLLGDVGGVTSPDGLGLVKLLVNDSLLLDLGLLLLLLLFLLIDLLDLGLLALLLLLLLGLVLNLLQDEVSSCKIREEKYDHLTFSTSLVTASWMG